MSKRIFCLVLAMMLTLGASVSALASETSPGSVETNGKINSLSGSATAELKGTIKATNLVVTVPSNIPFFIDPTVEASPSGTDDVKAQITAPEGDIKITNNSVVPVYAKISKVEQDGVTLVDAESSLTTTNKSAMLGIKKAGDISNFNTQTDWLTEGTDLSYYLGGTNGKIGANGDSENKNTLTLEVCGQAGAGWAANDTFTVTTTIVVSVTAPTGT